jgi:hypothetical protein
MLQMLDGNEHAACEAVGQAFESLLQYQFQLRGERQRSSAGLQNRAARVRILPPLPTIKPLMGNRGRLFLCLKSCYGSVMANKIGRDAFLFLEPHGGEDDFAQCGPCRMFVPGSYLDGKLEGDRCIIHGSDVEIDDDDSCGFFVPWPGPEANPEVVGDHARELLKDIPGSVTPEESGLVSRRVQCHRCKFEKNDATVCGLYEDLNKQLSKFFDCDTKIEPHACCNAQMPKNKTRESDSRELRDTIRAAVNRQKRSDDGESDG